MKSFSFARPSASEAGALLTGNSTEPVSAELRETAYFSASVFFCGHVAGGLVLRRLFV